MILTYIICTLIRYICQQVFPLSWYDYLMIACVLSFQNKLSHLNFKLDEIDWYTECILVAVTHVCLVIIDVAFCTCWLKQEPCWKFIDWYFSTHLLPVLVFSRAWDLNLFACLLKIPGFYTMLRADKNGSHFADDISETFSRNNTVYPKKYAHGFCFAVFCCGYTLTDFPISIRLTSLALWQSNLLPQFQQSNPDEYG